MLSPEDQAKLNKRVRLTIANASAVGLLKRRHSKPKLRLLQGGKSNQEQPKT
jgi:hypothetical protein